jgi:hypothetical protein
MMKVDIVPVQASDGEVTYRALAGDKQSQGRTAGEALDALRSQLPGPQETTLVIVQSFSPDRFFDARQQQRLEELMTRWREARDSGGELPADEATELNTLIQEEVRASSRRTAALLEELGR